jgi:tRNA(Arg) A34 adenosine deaminase TadA
MKMPKHLLTAIKVAEANENYPKWQLGSVIIKGGSTRAVGMNRLHTKASVASDEHLHRLATHAEEDALKRCGVPHGATIYVARIGRNGKVAMARPCQRCRLVLKGSGIKRAVYTITPTDYGVLSF